jgi:streptogramin lyase
VGSFYGDSILSYDETTGAFERALVPHGSGGLVSPRGFVIGQDGDLYVNSGKIFAEPTQSSLLVYDGTSGEFLDALVPKGHPHDPFKYADARGLVFGPDGNIYVSSAGKDDILQIDPHTGTILQSFVPTNSGGMVHPQGLVFGADGNLYVADAYGNSVLRYEGPTSPDGLRPGTPLPSAGNTGAFFVGAASGGLDHPATIVFGPDGNLYLDSGLLSGSPDVLRFDGKTGAPTPSAGNTGATFVAVGSGGLSTPHGVIFGPDNNLYVSDGFSIKDKSLAGSVLRYDGKTGQFIDTFVPAGSGGYQGATFLIFSETDPVTLVYNGTSRTAAAPAFSPVNQPFSTGPVRPLPTGAVTGWPVAAGIASLHGMNVRTADPGAATGDHPPGDGVDEGYVMAEMLTAIMRRLPSLGSDSEHVAVLDQVFAEPRSSNPWWRC